MVSIIEGYHRGRRQQLEEQRAGHHELAQLVAMAFHDPGSMPEYKPLAAKSEAAPKPAAEEVTTEADLARARGALIMMAKRSGAG